MRGIWRTHNCDVHRTLRQQDLSLRFFHGAQGSALLSVAGDSGTGHRQFKSQIQLDGGIDHGIEPEDLLLAIGVLGVAANPDPGIHIRGEFRAAKEEGIGLDAVIESDTGDHSPFNDKIKACSLQFFLKIEDLIEDTGLVGIGLVKAKGQNLHLWSLNIRGKPGRRAVYLDANFLVDNDSGRISEAVNDPLPDVIDDAFELDELTLLTEIGAAFVPGIGGEKSAIGGKDLIR